MADVLSTFARVPTRDPRAKQAALTALSAMRKGASYSGHFLKQAQEANAEFAKNPGSPALARRAVATRRAYEARMNAEVARQQAAFFMLAEKAGNDAAATRDIIARVQDAQKKQVLVERVRVFESRRNTLMQAAESMGKALQHMPPLPPGIAAGAPARQTNEVMDVAPPMAWRPKLYTERAGLFFTDDVRRMAGSLRGLGDVSTTPPTDSTGFWGSVLRAIGQGAAVVGQAAQAEGQRVSQADPSAAGAYQQAGGILQTLGTALGVDLQAGARGDIATPAPSQSSWTDYILPVAAGAAVLGVVVLLRR